MKYFRLPLISVWFAFSHIARNGICTFDALCNPEAGHCVGKDDCSANLRSDVVYQPVLASILASGCDLNPGSIPIATPSEPASLDAKPESQTPLQRPVILMEAKLSPPLIKYAFQFEYSYLNLDREFIQLSRDYFVRPKLLKGYESITLLKPDGTLLRAWNPKLNRTVIIHVFLEANGKINLLKFEYTMAYYYALRNSTRSVHAFDAYEKVNGRQLVQRYGLSLSILKGMAELHMIVAEPPPEENFSDILARYKAKRDMPKLELLIKHALLQMVDIVIDVRQNAGPYCAGLRLPSFSSHPFDPQKPKSYRLQLTNVTDIALYRDAPIHHDKAAPEIIFGNANNGTEPEVWNLGALFLEMLVSDHAPESNKVKYPHVDQRIYVSMQYIIQLFGPEWFPTEETWPGITQSRYLRSAYQLFARHHRSDSRSRPPWLPFSEGFAAKANELVWRMLVVNPEKRIKLEDIRSHPFFES